MLKGDFPLGGDGEADHVDPVYECDAPKFHDFSSMRSPKTDFWFEGQVETPFVDRAFNPEPLLNSELDGHEGEDFHHETPLAKKEGSLVRTPGNSTATGLLDENTPTPKASKQASVKKSHISHAFTPAKKSTLHQSLSWADMHPQPEEASVKEEESTFQHESNTPAPGLFVPVRSVKPLTVPVEFKFAREKKTTASKTSSARSQMLKPKLTSASIQKPSVTVPKPFKFHSTMHVKPKISATESSSPFVPLAVKVKQFESTPNRFRRDTSQHPTFAAKSVFHPTKPQSPAFSVTSRPKKEPVMSSEDRILADMQKNPTFKAKPVDLRVLNSHGDLGVPRIPKNPLTVPHSPQLTKSRPHTAPESEPAAAQPPIVLAKIDPKIYRPFQPVIPHREVVPLNFKLPGEELSERKKAQFEEALARKEEEEKRLKVFKAQPVYYSSTPKFHAASHGAVTLAKSPVLQTKVRGQFYTSSLEHKKLQEQQILKSQASFKASSVPDLTNVFVPKKSQIPPTENDPLVLNTEIRACEWKVFDMTLKEKEEKMDELKKEQDTEKAIREAEEVRQLRKQAEFKASGILTAPSFEPKKSAKPLTEPFSPLIGEKRKKLFGGCK